GTAHRRDRPLDVRDAAHELGGIDNQPYYRRDSSPPAAARTNAALHGDRQHPVPGAAAALGWPRARDGDGGASADASDPQPDSRRQDPSDLFGDANGYGPNGNADVQPEFSQYVFGEADYVGGCSGALFEPRGVAGHDQSRGVGSDG